VRTISAASADLALDSQKLGGVAASSYLTTSSLGTNAIRNQASIQTAANFNIDGKGTVGLLDVGGSRVGTSAIEVAAQDGLKITGFQPFLTLRDANTGNKQGFMQSINGDVTLLTDNRSFLTLKNLTGNVGVGNPTPAHHLSITGGPTWTTNGWAGVMSFSNGSAVGWEPNPSGQSYGIGQTAGGLYFFRTCSPLGQALCAAAYDMQITDTGNVVQDKDHGGLVKAMVVVRNDGVILRCYNGVTNNAVAPCGFSVGKPDVGQYVVTFNFNVVARFASLAVHSLSGGVFGSITYLTTQIYVFTDNTNQSPSKADHDFTLVVF